MKSARTQHRPANGVAALYNDIQFLEKTTSVLAADRSVPGEKPRNLYVPFQSGFRTAKPATRIRKDSTIKRIYTAYGHRWYKQA